MSLKHSLVVKLVVIIVAILLLNLLLGYGVVSYCNITVLQVHMCKRFTFIGDESNQSTTSSLSSLVYTSQTLLEMIVYPSNNISTTTEHEYNEYSQTNPTESVNVPQRNCSVENQLLTNFSRVRGNLMKGGTTSPTIFAVTATYTRYTQIADLISLCHTLMLVPNVVWIVIEDSDTKTNSVSQLLKKCEVQSVHLNAVTHSKANIQPRQRRLKGVMQRNAGLQWLRSHYRAGNCTLGVVYFADDDNRYDLRLFQEIRQTRTVSVLKVAFASNLKFEGPMCSGQEVVSWHSTWGPRAFPIDMAGFAINLWLVLAKPNALFGRKVHGGVSRAGYLETDFLEHFTTRESVECRGSETEVYVWHTHTSQPNFQNEKKMPSNPRVQLRR